MSSITENLQAVHKIIAHDAARFGRNPTEIALLAVSKTFDAEAIIEAWGAGQRCFGENYAQEGLDKVAKVASLLESEKIVQRPEWHFIGPLQSNKTRQIAEQFAWVHTVDREKIASRLSEQRPKALGKLMLCIQVNISGEANKSGVTPEDAIALAKHIASLPNLTLRGLMAVPEASTDFVAQCQVFRRLAALKGEIQAQGIDLDTLSMGMSADMSAAIAEGSTMLRVGSAIFGKRNYAV